MAEESKNKQSKRKKLGVPTVRMGGWRSLSDVDDFRVLVPVVVRWRSAAKCGAAKIAGGWVSRCMLGGSCSA